jgi:phospho-N-acetylmuramoyl-pentapeptide-transferase
MNPNRYNEIFDEKYIDHSKDKTPSMGGVLIVFSLLISVLLWGQISNSILWLLSFTTISFAILGFFDDYSKIKNRGDGISARTKMAGQFVIASITVGALFIIPETQEYMYKFSLPFDKNQAELSGVLLFGAIALSILTIVGASNAVNLTDGRDGLAIGCSIFCTLTYTGLAYLTGHKVFAEYLYIPYIGGISEVVVFTSAFLGAAIGFLWYNCHPASVFMGDTGSLAIGGIIATVAIIVRQELLLILVAGVFVIEALSVIIQTTYFKYSGGKRIFLCTPIHHHFERLGWTETQVVIRFWIASGVFALLGLVTLKLR